MLTELLFCPLVQMALGVVVMSAMVGFIFANIAAEPAMYLKKGPDGCIQIKIANTVPGSVLRVKHMSMDWKGPVVEENVHVGAMLAMLAQSPMNRITITNIKPPWIIPPGESRVFAFFETSVSKDDLASWMENYYVHCVVEYYRPRVFGFDVLWTKTQSLEMSKICFC
jgi:hypothetical protein